MNGGEPGSRTRATPILRTHIHSRSIDGVSIIPRPLVVPTRIAPRTNISTVQEPLHQQRDKTQQTTQAPQALHIKPSAPIKTTKKSKKSLLRHIFSKKSALISVTVCLVGLSLYTSLDSLWINQQTKAMHSATKQKEKETSAQVDETPLPSDALGTYAVAPSLPRIIRIESINVAARILRVGVTADNSLDTPKSAFDTGWYEGSAKPGEAGAMLIDGHYAGDGGGQAIFHNLEALKTGALITIEKGDGTVLKYAVEKVQRMPVEDVPMAQLLVSSKSRQSLNLITCTGNYNRHTQTYDQRIVVQAIAI